MADHSAMRASLWNALSALPKPVSSEAAVICAKEVLPGKEYTDFAKWMEVNGEPMLKALNG